MPSPTLRVEHLTDPGAFLALAGPLLVSDEARNNLLLGIAATGRDHPGAFEEQHFWVVRRAGMPVAAACMTPPRGLVAGHPLGPEAAAALSRALLEQGVAVPGAVGPCPGVDRFAAAWRVASGLAARPVMQQRIHRAVAVLPAPRAAGRLRDATGDDGPLLVAWMAAFLAEALGAASGGPADAERLVAQRLSGAGGMALWETDRPVSLAAFGGHTPSGVRIGPVYTPPEWRRRGYAGACVAALTSRLLAAGLRQCFLFTDRANPTANHVYAAVGYEPVCGAREYVFEPPR